MVSRIWQMLRRYFRLNAIRLFRLRGSSERVARGFALGLIVNFFPSFGFGVLLSGFVARLFGGNVLAGFIGGAMLTFFWPILFYFNIRVGSYIFPPPVKVEALDDVTERSIDALVWGRTFGIGALVNSVLFGLISYLVVMMLHRRFGPRILGWLRRRRERRQARILARMG
jgi:uncharacterized protein